MKTKHYCKDCDKELKHWKPSEPIQRCLDCYKKFNRRENHSRWKKDKIRNCIDCGKVITRWTAKRCQSCSRLKEKNPNWAGGISKFGYSFEFNDTLKDSIRKRDDYICQNCSMTQEEHFIVYGDDLHVHHIDYNKNNCVQENLITTCKQCNSRANFNRGYWQEFYSNKIRQTK